MCPLYACFRNDFKVIFGNLLVIDKQLVTQCVYLVVSAVLKDLSSYSVSDVEWAIFTISAIAENIPIPPPNQANDTQVRTWNRFYCHAGTSQLKPTLTSPKVNCSHSYKGSTRTVRRIFS